MLTLSNDQLQSILNHKACSEQGLNEVLTITLNAIMHSERSHFLQNQDANKANGYRPIKVQGYGRQLSLAIPRDRLGLFKPLLMLTLKEEEDEVKNLCFELYREGLTTRRISQVLEKIYGRKYSKSAVSCMSQSFQEAMKAWRERPIDSFYSIIYLDAIHAKVRRETVQGEAFYIALGVKKDYTREIIAIENQPTESALGWENLLVNLKKRGLRHTNLMVADGIAGLETKVLTHFPQAQFQKCVTHFKRNMLYKVRPKDKPAIANELADIFDLENPLNSPALAYEKAQKTINKWGKKYSFLKNNLGENNLRCYLTYLNYDFKVRSMIYTTNWIERLNKSFRQALKIRNAMPSVDSVFLLLSTIGHEIEKKAYAYPIYRLKYEENLNKKWNFEEGS